jgi:hypothetical protein
MPRNEAAAPVHVCPGIRIHVIDIVQPPGIVMPPIDDMDAHQTIVTTALAAKISPDTLKNMTPPMTVHPVPFDRFGSSRQALPYSS